MTLEEVARLEHAESMLTVLYWDIREKAPKAEVRRMDTICAKLYELKHVAFENESKKREGAKTW